MRIGPAPALAVVMALVASPRATACWVDHSVWESRVAGADLIGVLECVTAGVDVGRYRLVERWGGSVGVGHELTLGLYGLHLVGDRLLVVSDGPSSPRPYPARRVQYQTMNSSTGALTPLGGRALAVDRSVGFEAVRLPPPQGDRPLDALRSPHPTLEAFREAARALLLLDEPARELRVLQALARHHLRAPDDQALLKDVLAARTASAVARRVLQDGRRVWVLLQGGGAETLRALEAAGGHDQVVETLRVHLGLSPRPAPETAQPLEPRERRDRALVRLEALDEYVVSGEYPRRRRRADDPSSVVARIAALEEVEDPYWLASELVLRCLEVEERPFRALLDARSPWIRVAAAVYLALQDEAAGLPELERLQELDGDPGAWAALSLARRGHLTAAPRLLAVFGAAPVDASSRSARLRERARALLSNAAAQAGVEPPPRLDAWGPETEAAYREWWLAHAHALRLHDPWFEELRAQGID